MCDGPEAHARRGRCSCGAVRYEATGAPVRVSVCHCTDCQRRTGSAFGVGCYFKAADVTVHGGAMRTYERRSAAGRWVRTQFCEACGTSVMWTLEVLPGVIAIGAGTFEDTAWLAPKLHVWADSAQDWVNFPADADVLQQSNIGQGH